MFLFMARQHGPCLHIPAIPPPASKSDVGDTRVFDQVKFGKDYEIE